MSPHSRRSTPDCPLPPQVRLALPLGFRVAKVGLDVPLATTFDFLLADAIAADIGSLVVVPFGRQRLVGMIVEVQDYSDIALDKLRPIEAAKSGVAVLSPEILAVFQFCADYYHASVGQIALNAIPPALRKIKDFPRQADTYVSITAAGRDALESIPARAAAQRAVLALLAQGALARTTLARLQPRVAATLKRLETVGWIALSDGVDAPPAMPIIAHSPVAKTVAGQSLAPALNAQQQAAVESLNAAMQDAGCFQAFLLDGITGSGKTEVYLAAIGTALAQGRQALVLVPEINLTPTLLRRVRARFPAIRIAPAHSGMAGVARCTAWLAAQDGEADIVIGTRLAVFTPMPRLGLIVVDEEHDASFKQQEGVRYSARDVAVFRASLAKCPVVLGSATPSIETLDNVSRGRFSRLVLSQRAIAQAELPTVGFIDLDAEKAPDGLTQSMIRAIDETLQRGEQAMVFINRRGYAPALVCGSCGWMPECKRCSARMVFHRAAKRLKCHHCGAEASQPNACGECNSTDLHPAGQGSERIEDALVAAFPDRRIARVDRDSTRLRGSAEKIFLATERGELDILIGTQMLTKGHDFPKMTLVGVVNADGAVFSADFRAAEHMAQQLMQVAGRAGRAQLAGRVLIQTRFVEHPVYQAVATHNYAAFVRAALDERRLMHLPPFSYLALLRTESRDAAKLDAFMARAQQSAHAVEHVESLRIWEPVTATLERKAGYARKQLMVQADSRRALRGFLTAWIVALRDTDDRAVRWAIDVDPIDV